MTSNFPVELVERVIELSDPVDLFKLAGIARSFRPRAQQLIFADTTLVAGVGCVKLRFERPDNGSTILIPVVKPLPTDFKAHYEAFSKLDPTVLGYIRSFVLRGLNTTERTSSTVYTLEVGGQPHLDLCTVMLFLRKLPNLQNLTIKDVTWSTCSELTLDPTHHCIETAERRPLKSMTFRDILHVGPFDTIFDLLFFVDRCPSLSVKELRWPFGYSTVPIVSPSTPRPDVERLALQLPLPHTGIISIRYPKFSYLTFLDLSDVSNEQQHAIRDLITNCASTLETLYINAEETTIATPTWESLGITECTHLRTLRVVVEPCGHDPDDACAGNATIATIIHLIPPSLVSLQIHFVPIIQLELVALRLRVLPRWTRLVEVLSNHVHLQELRFAFLLPDDVFDDPEHNIWQEHLSRSLQPRINLHFDFLSDD
ncbi:hypothetical protein NM688_g9344 [Phlebia brevispora]|uniref:Uncharacterized protein n=1 Tax=Phlebia brevispora TaxID=194682 RepID=A0ACC1RGV5_9APHY|nr:hypothetical protein NM688_g9344 [Phlebia brevispora]